MPAFNARLLERCLALGDKDHYRKGGRETDLSAEDRKALLALPETRFDVVTWKRMKADKYGIVTVEGRHRYAAGPEHAGRELIVGLRAFEVRAASMPPGPASRRIRAPTATTPPAASGPSRGSGCRGDRPGAWPNSQVREALPDPLREWLDGQARAVLAEGLRTLRQAERESGWANAVAAMAEILETTGGIDRAGVCLAAARHAAGTEPVAYDEPVDPTRIRPGVRREGGQRMSQRNEERTDIDRLRARARALFISQATIDDLLAWATPRQLQAVDRLLRTELDNRETSKRARLLRRARFPVPKTLDGYDFTNVKLPDGYARDELLSLDFVGRAQDLVFYGKTGRGKTHLATALGMSAIDRGMNVRFLPTAELVLQLGRAKREGTLETMLKDIAKADLIILDEFGYVPFDVDGARLLYQVIAGSYERRSIIFTTNIEFSKWGTIFADDKLAASIIDRIVHHGRLIEFTGQSHRISQALMFGKPQNQ